MSTERSPYEEQELAEAVERAFVEQLRPDIAAMTPSYRTSPLLRYWLYWKPGDPMYDGPIDGEPA